MVRGLGVGRVLFTFFVLSFIVSEIVSWFAASRDAIPRRHGTYKEEIMPLVFLALLVQTGEEKAWGAVVVDAVSCTFFRGRTLIGGGDGGSLREIEGSMGRQSKQTYWNSLHDGAREDAYLDCVVSVRTKYMEGQRNISTDDGSCGIQEGI